MLLLLFWRYEEWKRRHVSDITPRPALADEEIPVVLLLAYREFYND